MYKNNIEKQSELILYVYLLNNLDIISCQCCDCIPGKNEMYRIKNSRFIYCKNCINKWLNKYNNPVTGNKLNNNDIEINYEINDLIEKYLNCKKLNIKNIKINISLNPNENKHLSLM